MMTAGDPICGTCGQYKIQCVCGTTLRNLYGINTYPDLAKLPDDRDATITALRSELDQLKQKLKNYKSQAGRDSNTIRSLKADVDQLREQMRWRKYPDEKPTKEGEYLVLIMGTVIEQCGWEGDVNKWEHTDGMSITHWMPLPQPPEEA